MRGHLDLAVLGGDPAGHELQVVDDDQAQAALAGLEPAGLGPHLHHRQVGVVVDEERGVAEAGDGLADLGPVRVGQASVADPAGVDPGLGDQQALGQLVVGHLQREDQRRDPGLHGGVGGHAQGEGGLAHRRPGPDDDQRRGLEAVQALVEIDVAGRHAGDGLAPVEEALQAVEGVDQQALQRLEAVGHPPFGHVEDQGLGPVDGGGDVVGNAVAHLGDLAGHRDQPAQEGVLLDDAGVAGGVGGRRRVGLQGDQRRQAADRRRAGRPGTARRRR